MPDERCMKFIKPTIDYNGKVYTLYKTGNSRSISALSEIPPGRYEFDLEESNEDVAVIYY